MFYKRQKVFSKCLNKICDSRNTSAENKLVNATENHFSLFPDNINLAHHTNGRPELDAMKNMTNNCCMDDSQRT